MGLGLSPESIYREMEKILRSRTFGRAPGQRTFLRYAVTEALEGRSHLLKEYSIGAFLKGDSFDPRMNSIVRTEARKLRARLDNYFDSEGRTDPVRIQFPVGRYVPVFSEPSRGSVASLTPRIGKDVRIGILPFVSRSASGRDESFSDGLTDELTHALARIPGLEVVARTSAYQFKGQQLDVREIGRRLNASAVVEGSVRTSGNRMRVIVQLVDASNGSTLWSGSYDRRTRDPFPVQQELSRTLSGEIGIHLGHRGESDAGNHDGHDTVRLNPLDEEYVTGRYFARRYTMEGYESAIDCYRQAIAKEPDCARAYSDLARCYVMLPFFKAMLSSELIPKVRAGASKALEIDASLGEAHVAAAVPLIHDFNWSAAGTEFRKGLELSPSDLMGHAWYGTYLINIGRSEEGLREHRRVSELDPTSPLAAHNYGLALYLTHRYDEAIRQFRKALSLNRSHAPSHAGLGLACIHKGSHLRGIAELETAEKLTRGPARVSADLAYAHAVSGNRDRAAEVLNRFLDEFDPATFPALMIAEIYIGLGDKPRAFEWLHRAVDQKDLSVFLKSDPLYDPLRSDERFQGLLERANFSQEVTMAGLSRREFLATGLAFTTASTLPAFGARQEPDPPTLTLSQASDRIRRGDLSPVELTEACLERIDRFDPSLNAFITVTSEEALAVARQMENEQRSGRWRGPLHGIPVALKDNIDTAGILTTAASGVFADRVPEEDAEVIVRLKAAGAVLLGKLNLHEFALGGTSSVSHFGAVRNPWSLEHNPGGSSGGSGAAIVADLCLGALGTDTGGSIRIPASSCGIVGLKPTYGRVSNRGVIPMAWTLDHVGPMTKTVEDAALMLGVLAGYDRRDPTTVDVPVTDYASGIGASTSGLRLGRPTAGFFENLHPEVDAALEAALGVLEDLTAGVRDVEVPQAGNVTDIWNPEIYAYHEPWITTTPELYQEPTRRLIEGAQNTPSAVYANARRRVDILRRDIARVFENVDLLITPTRRVPAGLIDPPPPPANAGRGGAPGGGGGGGGLNNTAAFDIYGLPTISIPCGFTADGLPIGMQISGAHFDERTVIALAHAYEQATEWHRRRPSLTA